LDEFDSFDIRYFAPPTLITVSPRLRQIEGMRDRQADHWATTPKTIMLVSPSRKLCIRALSRQGFRGAVPTALRGHAAHATRESVAAAGFVTGVAHLRRVAFGIENALKPARTSFNGGN
jgi:hypothetical protein